MPAASQGTRWLAGGVLCGALAAALPGPATAAAPTVRYVGHHGPDGLLASPATLLATAKASGDSRVVAVTFFLDGRALGTDTTAPYVLDVTPGLLRRGRHRLRVVAVDNLGRRASTRVTVRAAPSRARLLTASPKRGLRKALAALRRGSVTVRLAPGRYRLREVRLGDGARLIGSGRQDGDRTSARNVVLGASDREGRQHQDLGPDPRRRWVAAEARGSRSPRSTARTGCGCNGCE